VGRLLGRHIVSRSLALLLSHRRAPFQHSNTVVEKSQVEFTIPKNVPSGKYLVRVESIALHQASSVGGAQMYLSCAQIEVTGGGTGKPGPLVAFPGAYYPIVTSYIAPGPAVWDGN
jgi:hypothetical protein